jgi:DNA repair protein RecN (Recombination protein N)
VLKNIRVQNFALIDQAELLFDEGFTVITGETGSGKSILLGAIGLLLGQRADSKIFRNNELKCVIEAQFVLNEKAWKSFFKENDLDWEEVLTIRREILPTGKSRSFMNDTPVNVSVLKEAGARLIDIHSQHEQSLIGRRNFQLEILDAIAKNDEALTLFGQQYKYWQDTQKSLNEKIKQQAEWNATADFIRFQWEELEASPVGKMNAKETELQVETLENAEEIQSVLQGALHLLDGAEGIATRLHTLQQQLQKISRYGNEYALLADRIKALMIEAKDITGDVEGLADQAQSNPELLSELQEKMGEIYRLQQKHRVQDLDELLSLKDTWQSQLEGLGNAEEEIAQLEKEIQETEKQLLKTGALISQRRKEAGATLETELAQWLKQLSMEHAKIQVELTACSPKSDGCDDVQILFTANKGMTPQAIQQAASGGEISRVMLALKAVMASRQNLPAMILDEIDQGVSGDVGLKMGQLLQKCASQMQVIAISHLPQVASKANHHFKVFKEHGDQRTLTKVLSLDHTQRIQEIAEMLSGKTPTAAAIANAEDLLKA